MAGAHRPLIIAHHLVWTLYGWWLPNDPRGSMSRTVRGEGLADLGEMHFGRKRVQPRGQEVRVFYEAAGDRLKHPLLKFGATEFASVGDALGSAIRVRGYTCYACAVMPDHVHLLVRKHRDSAEVMIEQLQALSRERLGSMGLRAVDHPTWAAGGWKGFVDHPDTARRAIRYIDDNPVKQRLPRQAWRFVTPYDGWPLHAGHNLNSPYAKALRAAGRYPH